MQGTIETVNGQISVEGLGRVLMHEHIFVRYPELEINYPNAEWGEDVLVTRAKRELAELVSCGIDTIVDVTVIGLGRDVQAICRVADGLKLNIIVATGCYFYKDLPAYFGSHGPGLRVDIPEPLHSMFVRDIRDGVGNTNVKAGVIKIASDSYGLTDDVKRVFRAAASAHLETGVPITTHSNAKLRTGLDQQKFLRELGVDPVRMVIGHCGDTTDIDYLRSLMDGGSTIGMDRFGMDNYCPTADRIGTVVQLCRLGYADRMVLSHDAAVFSANSEPDVRAKWLPNWNYQFVPRVIISELLSRGVTADMISQMMVGNPKRILPSLKS